MGLQVKLLATSLELVNAVLGPAGQVNVDRCPHASAQVGGAGVDVAEPLIQAEVLARLLLDRVLDGLDTLGEPGEDFFHISSLLHGDDAELVFFVDPDKESLVLVMEDTTTLGPVTLHASNSKVPVARDEEEVVINELLTSLLVHSGQGVVVAGKIGGEVLDSVDHQLLDSNTLLLADSVVFADEGVEDGSKVLVRVPVTSVDAAVLVVEFNGASDRLDEGEAGSLGLDSLELLPLVLGDVLGNEGVLGLDGGERSVGLGWHWFVLARVTSGEGLVFLPQGVDTVNHLLDQLDLRVSEPVLVGDVIGVSGLATRLSTGSTGLQVKLLATSLELVNAVLGPAGQVNVDGGPHASAKVGGAGVDVAEPLIQAEVLARLSLDRVLDSLDTLGQSAEHFPDISTLLHRDNTELVLLVDPDEEGLLGVVEDTTSLGPVALHTSNSKVPVARDEEEVVVNELLTDLLIHSSQRVVLSSEVRGEVLDRVDHQLLNSNTLLLGDSGGETEAIDGTANTDSARVDGDIRVDIALNLADVHVRGVPCRGTDSVVLLDQGVKDWGEVFVRVPVTGVDAAVLVVELDCAGNGL